MRAMTRRRAWTGRRLLLAVALVVVLLLAGGQLLLPALAARQVRKEVGDPDASVDVAAYPAWKLVAGRADRVTVRAAALGTDGGSLTDLLRRAADVGETHAVIGRVRVGDVTLRALDARIADGRLRATARLSLAELSARVPGGGRLEPLPAGADGRPRLRVTTSVLGVRAGTTVVLAAREGRIEVAPEAGLASLLLIPVFSDPALRVDGVRGSASGDVLSLAFTGALR